MELVIGHILYTGKFFYTSGLVAASLLFVMIGYKNLKLGHHEGIIYWAVAFFFMAASAILVTNDPESNISFYRNLENSSIVWTVFVAGPAVVLLYLTLSIYSLFKFELYLAILKMLLALILILTLFHFGYMWPEIIKAGIVLLFSYLWFKIELRDYIRIKERHPRKRCLH